MVREGWFHLSCSQADGCYLSVKRVRKVGQDTDVPCLYTDLLEFKEINSCEVFVLGNRLCAEPFGTHLVESARGATTTLVQPCFPTELVFCSNDTSCVLNILSMAAGGIWFFTYWYRLGSKAV